MRGTNFEVSHSELQRQLDGLQGLDGPLSSAVGQVQDKPDILAFTEWAAGIVAGVFGRSFTGFGSGTLAAQRLVQQVHEQLVSTKEAYTAVENANCEGVRTITASLEA